MVDERKEEWFINRKIAESLQVLENLEIFEKKDK